MLLHTFMESWREDEEKTIVEAVSENLNPFLSTCEILNISVKWILTNSIQECKTV